MNSPNKHSVDRYIVAISLTLVAFFVSILIWPLIKTTPFVLFYAAVTITAWYGGLAGGVVASALSVSLAGYFLIEPRFTVFSNFTDVVQFTTFCVLAFLISWTEDHRRNSEQLLRQARDQLHIILNGITEGVTAQDKDGKPVFANNAAAFLTGYESPSAMIGLDVNKLHTKYEMFDTRGHALPYSALPRNEVFRTGKPASRTFQMYLPDKGVTHWIELKSAPIFDQQGNVTLAVNIFRDVTELMALEQERTKYQAIVRYSGDAIISKSLDGKITSWNAGAEALYGYSTEEAVGQHISITFPPEIRAQEMLLTNRIKRGEKIENYDTIRLRKDGTRFHVSKTISPIHDYLGEIVGFATIERDVTHRVLLEKHRAETERHLRKVLDTLPILVGVMKPDGTLIEANQAALQAAELSPSDVLYKPFPETYWWAYSPAIQEQLRNAIERAKQGETVRYDVPVRISENRFMTIDFMISPMYSEDGELTHLIPSALDITDRIQRESEILRLTIQAEAQRRRLKNIIANVPGVVYEGSGTYDNGSERMDFISDYAEQMLGYPLEEWQSAPNFWKYIIHPDDWEASVQRGREVYSSREPGNVQFRCITKSGEIIHVEAHSTIITDAEGNYLGTCGVVMDITKRKQMEEVLLQYTDELQRSNQELEHFAYVASHDLQEPLRMVTSYLQLIEKRYRTHLDDDASEFIQYAVDGATRMKTLINDLLTYSRIQRNAAPFAPVDMNVVLEQVIHHLQFAIEDHNAHIEIHDLPQIIGNEGQLIQLMQNLVGNALKFHKPDVTPEILVCCKQVAGDWVFSVQDNGIGIDPQYADKIFIIFQRLHTRDDYSGTGIGLAVSKKIVEKHHGKIWLESAPNEGTTFYFSIPVRQRTRISLNGSN